MPLRRRVGADCSAVVDGRSGVVGDGEESDADALSGDAGDCTCFELFVDAVEDVEHEVCLRIRGEMIGGSQEDQRGRLAR
jgi:hypothetical protein